jgi:hypothetical protein
MAVDDVISRRVAKEERRMLVLLRRNEILSEMVPRRPRRFSSKHTTSFLLVLS